jgi:hypothetical protein
MPELLTSRRSFLTGLGAVLAAAPAIVRARSLMPVRNMILGSGDRIPYLSSAGDIMKIVMNARTAAGLSDIPPISINGIPIEFDCYAPDATIYLMPGLGS